ncbi:MAG TPA: hypothetical protein VD928_00175, partial [Candidatus Paceibacterota bacterium]|nr:hypothetical protein [Candidatus Paceibacterota bacterium]
FFIISVTVLLLLTNQHVLTGMILHPAHFHWYITKPLLGIMLGIYAAYLLHFLFKNKRYVRIGATAAALFILFYTSPLLHPQWYKENPDPPVVTAQAYAPALRALKDIENTQNVWADKGFSTYVPIYTKHDASNNPLYTIYYLNPQSFYENTMFLEYRLKGETPQSILETLTKDRVTVSETLFGLYYRQLQGSSEAIPDEILSELAEKYRVFYARPYIDILRDLKITVVVAPTQQQVYSSIPELHPFVVAGSYTIYTVAP